MTWHRGPLPSGTYGWGGVVPAMVEFYPFVGDGFYFVRFEGDRVRRVDDTFLYSYEIAWWNNCLTDPPTSGNGYANDGW